LKDIQDLTVSTYEFGASIEFDAFKDVKDADQPKLFNGYKIWDIKTLYTQVRLFGQEL
jgi:hypothetical protein